jgi:hypothetical protein
LVPEPLSVSVARHFVRDRFVEWQLDEMIDEAQIALSELVTNALLHGAPPLSLAVSSAEGMVELAVFDGNPVPPVMRPPRSDIRSDLDEVLSRQASLGAPTDDRDPRLYVGDAGALTGGRGLLLVNALTAEWGVSSVSDGKAVWVRAEVPKGWPHAASCPCGNVTEDLCLLASGHHAVHNL